METDTALLDAAKSMDEAALVKIFDLYAYALYKYAFRICNDSLLADQIVGDVFAKLLDKLSCGKRAMGEPTILSLRNSPSSYCR